MENFLQKIKRVLIYIIVATLPVMTYINLFGKIKVNVSVADIIIALLMVVTFIDYKNFKLKRYFPYWWYFGGLVIWSIISNTIAYYNQSIASGSMLSTINELIKFCISGLYFYAGYNSFKDREECRKILSIWVYTAAIISVIGIFITINLYSGSIIKDGLFIHSDVVAKRLLSTLTDPNLAAAYFNLSFWITVILANSLERKNHKCFSLAVLCIIFVSLLLTQSRSGIISFISGLFVFVVFRLRNIFKHLPIILLFIFILYFGILNIDATYFDKNFYNSTTKRFQQVAEGSGEWEIRSNLWKAAFMMGKDNPIFGVGRGNYVNNSKIYYEKMGIDTTAKNYEKDYGIKIPHNTYATFFAELGIIGFMLFMSMFLLIAKKIILSKNICFIAMLFTYMVQAFAVNLENFRGIWFVLPFALLIDNVEPAKQSMMNESAHVKKIRRLVAIYTILIIIAVIVFLDTAPKYSNPVILEDNFTVAYIDDVEDDEDYILRYYIEAETVIEDEPSSFIKIYAIGLDGKSNLIEELSHYTPKGYAFIPFTTPKDIDRIAIEVNGTSKEKKVTIENMLLVNKTTGKADRIFIDSKYIPNNIEKYLDNTVFYKKKVIQDIGSYKLFANTFVSDNADVETAENKTSLYFKGDKAINISDKVLFLGAIKEKVDDDKLRITLRFKCMDKIDKDYTIWFHGSVIDKSIVSENRKKYGFENWDHGLKIKTTNWQEGQIYEDTFEITVREGHYNLRFGFWNSKTRDRLYPAIELGWIFTY